MRPRSSAMMTRSASPSSAMPTSARISFTFWQSAAGSVEPHSWLMLKPSGSIPIAITSASSSRSASGVTR
jgi:hypothetical protein